MRKPTVRCALLAALIAKHRWGTPITEDQLLSVAAIETAEYPEARRAIETFRSDPYVTLTDRGLQLDPARFGDLAEVLYHECGWEPYEIRLRLKHYEGWERHGWA